MKNWYVINTYFGFEERVKKEIIDKSRLKGLDDKISQILIPTEKIIEFKDRKKIEKSRKFYPSYILIELELDDEIWHLIKNVSKVIGFVGGIKPSPVLEEEIIAIIQQQEKGNIPVIKMNFEKNETVKITDGPFVNFVGSIDEVDIEHNRMKVMVSIFGRQTPMDLSFSQVEKIQ